MALSNAVFEAVRRGYNELDVASNDEIIRHFDAIKPDAMIGHVSNIKGILFEQQVVDSLNEQGIEAFLFEATNHPISDITLMSDGDIAAEMQLKATDSVSYINEILAAQPDVPIIATSEVADNIDSTLVIDSGLENHTLDLMVTETLSGKVSSEAAQEIAADSVKEGLAEVIGDSILPISPIGIIGALLGLPFL